MLWGATKDEWELFSRLVPADIRPTVNNPDLLDFNGTPIKDRYTKTPSLMYSGGVAGIKGWPTFNANESDIKVWSNQPDYGFGIVGRTLKGIDIDVEDKTTAEKLDEFFTEFFGSALPMRQRVNSERRMLLFRFSNGGFNRSGAVFQLPNGLGAVEFKFDKSFIACCGVHKSGARQIWYDVPETVEEIPTIRTEQIDELYEKLKKEFNITVKGGGAIHTDITIRRKDQADVDDPMYQFIVNSEHFIRELPDGKIAVKCPWEDLHSSKGADTDTVFLPKGLGGRTLPGFKCLHTLHGGQGEKTLDQFLNAIGYTGDFEIVESATEGSTLVPHWDRMSQKDGTWPCTEVNVQLGLKYLADTHELEIAYDEFRAEIIFRTRDSSWQRWVDENQTQVALKFNEFGCRSVSDNKLRDGIRLFAVKNKKDIAIDWLNSLQWDGIKRIDTFHTRVLGCADTDYHREAMRYLWSALAGRILKPGVKADMVPVLIGAQGVGKTSFVQSLTPENYDWYCNFSFSIKDADASRLLRGRCVVELDELRGLGTREEESIKSWITKTKEDWIPKFKEFSASYLRRFIAIGTSNQNKFLSDSTGSRRWLPITVCKNGLAMIDNEYVKENLTNLWAEARELYKQSGVLFERVSKLAIDESIHRKAQVTNFAAATIAEYMKTMQLDGITVLQAKAVLQQAGMFKGAKQIYGAFSEFNLIEEREDFFTWDCI